MAESTNALVQLEELLSTGRVRRAVEARTKAHEREDAQHELAQFRPHHDKFVAASMVAADAVATLEAREREKLTAHAKRIREVAISVRGAAADETALRQFGRLLTDARTDMLGATSVLEQGFINCIRTLFDPLEGLGRLVEGMPSLTQLGKTFAKLATDGRRLIEKFPPTETQLGVLAGLKERRRAAMDQLSSSDAGAELADFLLAVASQQATLANVTPAVRRWLDEHNASVLFRVRFAQ